MGAELVTLYPSNFRDPVATLRAVADEIEAGKYGRVEGVGMVLLGDTLEVFGIGERSEVPFVVALFNAGIVRLVTPMAERGA